MIYSKNLSNQPKLQNILTIDVEDWFHILDMRSTPSLDVWHQLESRVVSNTLLILDILSTSKRRGTFFVLGWVAENFPDLVREIERQGHEIGTHGYGHELVYKLSTDQFRRDVSRSLDSISRITSQPILGYRAPGFSITPASFWALDILVELGISYDASIFPMKRNHGGYQDFSAEVRWIETLKGNRILEVPVTPIEFLMKKVYLFGGGYFRLAPYWAIASGIKQLNARGKSAMVYLHPRELDSSHPKLKMNFIRYFKSYVNLKTTKRKFKNLLNQYQFDSIENVFKLKLGENYLLA